LPDRTTAIVKGANYSQAQEALDSIEMVEIEFSLLSG